MFVWIGLFIYQLDHFISPESSTVANAVLDRTLFYSVNNIHSVLTFLSLRPCSAAAVCAVLQRGPEEWHVIQRSSGGHVRLHYPAVWEQRGEMVSVIYIHHLSPLQHFLLVSQMLVETQSHFRRAPCDGDLTWSCNISIKLSTWHKSELNAVRISTILNMHRAK